MKYSLFSLVLASSASASLQIRDVAAIESDISTLSSQLQSLTDSLSAYGGDIATALPVETSAQTLEKTLRQATSDVGTDVVSEDDSNTILGSINSLIPNVIAALNSFVSKRDSFSDIGLADVATQTINDLQTDTTDFANALVAVAAPEAQAAATSARACITDAFSSAVAGSTATSCGGSSTPTTTSSGSSPTTTSSGTETTSAPTSTSSSATVDSTTSPNAAVATGRQVSLTLNFELY